jgi:hypothetical protein
MSAVEGETSSAFSTDPLTKLFLSLVQEMDPEHRAALVVFLEERKAGVQPFESAMRFLRVRGHTEGAARRLAERYARLEAEVEVEHGRPTAPPDGRQPPCNAPQDYGGLRGRRGCRPG